MTAGKVSQGPGRKLRCPVCATGDVTEDIYRQHRETEIAGKEAILQKNLIAQSSHPELLKSISRGIKGEDEFGFVKWMDPADCRDGEYWLGWAKKWNRPHFCRWDNSRQIWSLETGAKGVPTVVTKAPIPNLKGTLL